MANLEAMLRPIKVPDVLPTSLPKQANFSLVAGAYRSELPFSCLTKSRSGDFEEIYGAANDPDEPQAGQWNAILTCFFLDTVGVLVPKRNYR